MSVLNRACAIGYEVALVLVLVLAVLAPLHAGHTRHLWVVQTLDPAHAVIEGELRGVAIGDLVPLYRFNAAKYPIGEARVESIDGNLAQIYINPEKLARPLGRHARLSQTNGKMYVQIGQDQDIFDGTSLTLCRSGTPVGQVRVVLAERDRSLVEVPPHIGAVDGLTATEYSAPTEAAVFVSRPLAIFEIALIAVALAQYAALYVWKRRSPFVLAGEALRTVRWPKNFIFWAVHVLAGIPFSWLLSKISLYVAAYLGALAYRYSLGTALAWRHLADSFLPFGYALIGVAYYAYLVKRRRSPILDFWELISYKGRGVVRTVSWQRGLTMWTLHLVIVFAFGWTLIGWLRADVYVVLAIGSNPQSTPAVFDMLKYSIFCLTIVGCLVGYGYSVVSIFWGKFIRNVDFTVPGWLTNALCYGPLLGIVFSEITPPRTGMHPIVTAGPLLALMLGLGFLLNLLYMLSIWNLGTMFDLMSDKGVRTSLFYSVVRHPSYTLETCMFFVTNLAWLTHGLQWLNILMYFLLYWVRSEREDNFMEYSNPEYAQYQHRLPWKFIPGVY